MKITSQNMIHKCHVESVLSRALMFYSGTGRDILRTWGTLHVCEPIPIINLRPITRKHAGQCQLSRHLLLSAAGMLYTTTALTLYRLKQPHPATKTPPYHKKQCNARDKHSLDQRKRHHTILSPKPRKAIVLEQGFSCPLVCEVHQRQLSQKIIKAKCDRAVARFIITFVARGSLKRSAGGGVLHPPTGATALLRPEVISYQQVKGRSALQPRTHRPQPSHTSWMEYSDHVHQSRQPSPPPPPSPLSHQNPSGNLSSIRRAKTIRGE